MKASRRSAKGTARHEDIPARRVLDIANADDGEFLAEHLYSDVIGFRHLLEWSGNPGRAVTTIKAIVRKAAQQGRNDTVKSWSFFRNPILADLGGTRHVGASGRQLRG
jgi:hypothetical protein